MSTWRIVFLFALISGFVMIGCPEDDPVTDDDDDDDVTGDDDDDNTGDDDSATGDDDDTMGDDDDTMGDDDDTGPGQPDIQTQPSNLDFGNVAVGATADIALDIRNIGNAPLEINNMASPLTQLNFTPYTGPIPPGGTQTVVVTGVCTVAEEVTGGLIITSNDPDENPLHIITSMSCQ